MAKEQKKESLTTRKLDPRKVGCKIQDMHALVQAEMTRKGWTAYALAKAVHEAGGKASEQTIRNFLAGASMRSNHLEVVFAVLGLEVRRK